MTADPRALEPLSRAPTLRTASILLDQYRGEFSRAVASILRQLDDGKTRIPELDALANLAPAGWHLTEPWKVVVAGPPNVGKSSLINAVAGYQRAVVSPVAGTTRDAVSTLVALDGWPVELTDTAGLRTSEDRLEVEGVETTRRTLEEADGIVWVLDGTADEPAWPDTVTLAAIKVPVPRWAVVVNKVDQPLAEWVERLPECSYCRVSATTGEGVSQFVDWVMWQLLRQCAPKPGDAVPFTSQLAEAVVSARDALAAGDVPRTRAALAGCIVPTV